MSTDSNEQTKASNLEDRMEDEAEGCYLAPVEDGTCCLCIHRRSWTHPSGSFSLYCGYCSDRNLEQPSTDAMDDPFSCKGFKRIPDEEKVVMSRIVRSTRPPFGAAEGFLGDYEITGDEPIPEDALEFDPDFDVDENGRLIVVDD